MILHPVLAQPSNEQFMMMGFHSNVLESVWPRSTNEWIERVCLLYNSLNQKMINENRLALFRLSEVKCRQQ